MNARQQLAIEKHCRFAFETLQPGLSWATPTTTVVLSVNSGYE
jgi:hypothetical protein